MAWVKGSKSAPTPQAWRASWLAGSTNWGWRTKRGRGYLFRDQENQNASFGETNDECSRGRRRVKNRLESTCSLAIYGVQMLRIRARTARLERANSARE